ncbi:TerB family tellurite resistance protein [Methylobacterium terricola]|uniref:TerB family tellurite resistance protein n=1 Tax=Methylobacterium terricola TaxID=2583531 RepID=A0A5C4LPH5_9HYPH|nr:TerB family tellurite resistance protein [Methylobacterium terricola]TNC15329.1 TerB family tellurite resistance protein [Methylobacterium terricola]
MPLIARLRAYAAEMFGAPVSPPDAGDEPHLAAAALLVHVARVDGTLAAVERDRLARLLTHRFAPTEAAAKALIERAIGFDDQTRDVAELVEMIGRDVPEEERRSLLGLAWAVAAADGQVHEFEDDLVWRLGQLLGFDDAAITATRAVALAGLPAQQMPAR